MTIRRTLLAIARVVADEAERNEDFGECMEKALSLKPARPAGKSNVNVVPRKGGRRKPAVFDPVELARKDEDILQSRLMTLRLDQLLDIVAQYGMDPGKLVMKWKKPDRIIDRIVEISLSRAKKGDAFRGD